MLTARLRIVTLAVSLGVTAFSTALAQKPVVVQGTVTSEGEPVAGIEVRLYAGVRFDQPLSSETDASGTFRITIPGLPDTTWQTFTLVVADQRIHKGYVRSGIRRDPVRRLGPYDVEPYRRTARASLGSSLDDLEELRRYAGNELAVRAGVEELRTIFPTEFIAGSVYAARAEALERPDNPLLEIIQNRWAGIGADPSSRIAVAGSEGRLNSYMIDGVSMDDRFGLGQTAPPANSTISIERDRFRAENAEGGIRVDTRSGTDLFTGSLFEYFRHRGLNGNSKINEDRLLPKGSYRAHQFGGSAGGPIIKGGHFFFVSVDGQTLTREQTVFANVPNRGGVGGAAADAVRRLESLAAHWDLDRRQTVAVARTDHNFTEAHRLSFRFGHQGFSGYRNPREGTQQSRESVQRARLSAPHGSVSLTSTFSLAVTNEVRAHYGRSRESDEPESANPHAEIREQGTLVLAIGGSAFAPRRLSTTRLQFADTFSWVPSSAHELKAGIEIQDDDNLHTSEANFAGSYVFDSLAAFASGRPIAAADTFTQAFAGAGIDRATTTRPDIRHVVAFGQDRWKVTDEVTVNLGVRYQGQRLGRVNPRQLNDIAPRIGVALGGYRSSLVVRAGYGIFYSSTSAAMLAAAETHDARRVQTLTFHGGSGAALPVYPARLATIPDATPARPVLFAFAPDFRNGRTHEANGSVGFRWHGHSVDLNYSHTKGTGLPQSVDTNVGSTTPTTFTVAETGERVAHYRLAPGPSSQYARVISLQSTAEARRRALTIDLSRIRPSLVSYRLTYTLADLTDTVPDSTALIPESPDDRKFPSNPADLDADRGPGDADVRHRALAWASVGSEPLRALFPASAWPIVDNWLLSVLWRLESGRPYSAYVTTDINGDRNRFNDIAPGTRRNQFRFPVTSTLDLRVTKEIRARQLGDRGVSIQLDAFNLLNRANYTVVNNTLYAVDGTVLRRNPLFGQLTDQADPRVVQAGVRLSF